MATVLWYQGEMNEERILMENKIYWATDKQPIVDMLYRYAYVSIETEKLKKMRERGYDISNHIKYFYMSSDIKHNIIYIQSCFVDKDKRKRRMPFMYYTDDCIKMAHAAVLLADCARMINKRCSTDEINYFKNVNEEEFGYKDAAKYLEMATGTALFSYLSWPMRLFGTYPHRNEIALHLFKEFGLKEIPCGSINVNEEVVDYTRERASLYSYK